VKTPKFQPGQQVMVAIPSRPELAGTVHTVLLRMNSRDAAFVMGTLLRKHGLFDQYAVRVMEGAHYYQLQDIQIPCHHVGGRSLGFSTDIVHEDHLRHYYPPTNVSCDEFMKGLLKAKPKGIV